MIALLCLLLLGSEPQAKATDADYKTVLDTYRNIQEKLFDPKKVNEIEITNIKTNKKGKVTDLSELEKDVFIVLFAQEVSVQTTKMQAAWKKEIDSFKKTENNAASLEQIKKFNDELLEIRKNFASEMEDFICKMIDRHKEEMAESEAKNLIKRVRFFHDKQELIARKKE